MSTKRLVTTSIFALISASAVQAADVMIPHQPTPVASSTFVAPAFSWTGLYLGGQAGGFSSKADMSIIGKHKTVPLSKDLSPKLSGFEGGVFAGSNIDLGDNFVLGIDTDFIWSGQKHTKTITISAPHNATIDGALARARRSAPSTPTTTVTPTQTPTSTELPASPPQTAAAKPAPVKPAPAQTAAAKPVPVKPAPAQTAAAKPVPVKPAPAQTAAAQPASVQPAPAQPVLVKPASASVQTSSAGSETPKAPAVQSATGGSGGGLVLARSASPEPAPAKLAPAQAASAKPAAPASPEKSETIKSSGGTVGTTVPTGPLALARSGGAGSANGGVHHTSHGSYHAYSHSAGSHHHAGANPHSYAGGSSHNPNLHGSHSRAGAGMAGGGSQAAQGANKNDAAGVYGIEQIKEMASELGIAREGEVATLSHTLKQNWSGATRVRVGFAADRFMPYIAGGIAYAQLQDTVSVSFKREGGKESSKNLTDETKTMIGYTLGGGVDFAVLDNVIVRAEYRYSDFGKKKFAKEKLELDYKTNDFRVGVAYKF